MNILIIGSTGRAGSRIVNEAKERGHNVIAISRSEKHGLAKSLWDLTTDDLKNIDVLISAFGTREDQALHLEVAKFLDKLMLEVNKPWYVVGGAGSLYIDENTRLVDSKDFEKSHYVVAAAMKKGLDYLQAEGKSKWSYFSPAAMFAPGEKTGKYILGGDQLLTNESGESYISMEDYAVAMLDVAEEGKYIRKRFTIVQK